MRDIKLLPEETQAFGRAVVELRWDGEKYKVDLARVVVARRTEQKEDSLYNVYNRAQEMILRGGVYVQNVETKQSQKACAVGSLSENIRLNKALWTLADEMAKLKSN